MKLTKTTNRSLRTFHAAILIVALSVATFGQAGGSPLPEKTTAVYGPNIHYIEAGQRPAVILLHGLGGTKEMWSANFAALASRYHVYALDQLGWSDSLQGFMQSQNLPKATVVGNSSGGWIATEFTAASEAAGPQ